MNVNRTFFAAAVALTMLAANVAAGASSSLEERIQERNRGRAEQLLPRTAAPFDPIQFDKYVGIYQRAPSEFFVIFRRDDHFFLDVKVPGPEESHILELYPESAAKFFSQKPVQISFPQVIGGKATKLLQHSGGFIHELPRVDETVVTRAMAATAARVKSRTPQPDSQGKLRRFIEGFQNGAPNYDEIGQEVAVLYATDLLQKYTDLAKALGAVKSVTLAEVTPSGADKYSVVGENGHADATIDLSTDGKIDTVIIGKLEK